MFSRKPDCSCLQMSTFVKAAVELEQTWGPPGGLEEALFTCSEECCPARTLLYLTGTQGHSAGRDGRLCPTRSFHLVVSTAQHNVGDENGIPAHVATVLRNCSSGPFYLWLGRMTDGFVSVKLSIPITCFACQCRGFDPASKWSGSIFRQAFWRSWNVFLCFLLISSPEHRSNNLEEIKGKCM